MTDYEARVAGEPIEAAEGWQIDWADRAEGIARVASPEGTSELVVVDGGDEDWWVTMRGRRIGVVVRSWRERALAAAALAPTSSGGPITVTATLPGLIVAVAVGIGDEVEAGFSILTIEAMKMQNEVRAPRAGRISEVSVSVGQAVATGAPLVRLE